MRQASSPLAWRKHLSGQGASVPANRCSNSPSISMWVLKSVGD
jgi:hypothetical protein